MRKLLRKILQPVWGPLAKRYIARDRHTRFHKLSLWVKTGVFHPGLFFAAETMARFLSRQQLDGLRVLEMGAGTGALSLLAARKKAVVTAVDVHPDAVMCITENSRKNALPVSVFLSDLYSRVPAGAFDRIIVNPPFYPKTPQNDAEKAWFCGENFEFFERFFNDSGPFLAPGGVIWMVVSEDCNMTEILGIATAKGYDFQEAYSRYAFLERNDVYALQRKL